MLYVKIMSAKDFPDDNPYANFTIVPIENDQVMAFVDNPMRAAHPDLDEPRYILEVHAPDGGIETHELTGNAYVMNESGKTIATHGC